MMESARDKAIRLLMELVDPANTDALTRVKAMRVVDSIIDAARASESEHSREVQKLRADDHSRSDAS